MSDADDEISTMIADIEQRESKLNEWESQFMQSIGEQLSKGKGLTAKQNEILERVWDKVTR